MDGVGEPGRDHQGTKEGVHESYVFRPYADRWLLGEVRVVPFADGSATHAVATAEHGESQAATERWASGPGAEDGCCTVTRAARRG